MLTAAAVCMCKQQQMEGTDAVVAKSAHMPTPNPDCRYHCLVQMCMQLPTVEPARLNAMPYRDASDPFMALQTTDAALLHQEVAAQGLQHLAGVLITHCGIAQCN